MEFAETLIHNFGYLGLFIGSFLGATVVPLSTGFLVMSLPALGFSPWLVGLVAALGSALGSITMFGAAHYGGERLLQRFMTVDQEKLARARAWVQTWGAPALLLTFMPFIGDALVLTAGLLKMRFSLFAFWIFAGRVAQYAVMIGVADTAVRVLAHYGIL
jgi:membrane protein YqaA with SNARE-associated domain